MVFEIAQHYQDKQLLLSFRKYFNCGKIRIHSKNAVVWSVYKFDDIVNIIIPFFQKFPIIGVKELDFRDWCKVAELMKNKAHLTKDGLDKIHKIKAGMNRGRK